MKVVLITRQGCHLCDQALEAIRALGVEPELADVDASPELHALYDWRVPVVMVDGRVVAEGRIEVEQLRKALATGPRPRRRSPNRHAGRTSPR